MIDNSYENRLLFNDRSLEKIHLHKLKIMEELMRAQNLLAFELFIFEI